MNNLTSTYNRLNKCLNDMTAHRDAWRNHYGLLFEVADYSDDVEVVIQNEPAPRLDWESND